LVEVADLPLVAVQLEGTQTVAGPVGPLFVGVQIVQVQTEGSSLSLGAVVEVVDPEAVCPLFVGIPVVRSLFALGVLIVVLIGGPRFVGVQRESLLAVGALVEAVDLRSAGVQVVGSLLAVGVLVAVLDHWAEGVLWSVGALVEVADLPLVAVPFEGTPTVAGTVGPLFVGVPISQVQTEGGSLSVGAVVEVADPEAACPLFVGIQMVQVQIVVLLFEGIHVVGSLSALGVQSEGAVLLVVVPLFVGVLFVGPFVGVQSEGAFLQIVVLRFVGVLFVGPPLHAEKNSWCGGGPVASVH
jgi:hypothetical protein